MGKTGIGSHTRPFRGKTDEWITPREIIDALGGYGSFDLDPCASATQPWPCAKNQYTVAENGLSKRWFGRVWLNPPYGPATGLWLSMAADLLCATALIFARSETEFFHRQVWERADGLLFLEGRLHFYRPDGTRASFNAGGPSVLAAYGARDANTLRKCELKGAYVEPRRR